MVRFKNRHLLVEFLDPAHLKAFPDAGSLPSIELKDEDEFDDDEEALAPIPPLPFVLPVGTGEKLLGDDGTSAVFKAVRACVQSVFGDEGWGRVASSLKVFYHSPLTTLTIMRVARQHYRMIWAAVSLLTEIDGVRVLPRVVAVSGTIKKLQSAAIVYHRRVTAAAVAGFLAKGAQGEAERERLESQWNKEREEIARVQD